MIKIEKYDKFNIHQKDCYSFHVIYNNCPNIKVGDDIEIDGIIGEVETLEWFMKSFDIKGDNVVISVKSKIDKINIELTKDEAKHLLACLVRTSASGKDLDVGEMVENKICEFLKK